MRRRRTGLAPLAALVVACVAAGCGGSDDASPEPVTVEGGEYAFVVSDGIEGGVTAMRFVNTGQEPHEFALTRIDDGHSLRETVAALMAGDGRVPWAEDIGGVPLLSPGEEITVTRALKQGSYGLVCFFPSPNGKPHVELGMLREFEVAGESDAAPPTPDAVITARPDGFSVPELEAGTRVLELRNESDQEVSWYLFVPQPGATTDDFGAWMEGGQKGEAPLTFLGAMQSFEEGPVYVTLDLVGGVTYRLEDDPGGLPAVDFTPR